MPKPKFVFAWTCPSPPDLSDWQSVTDEDILSDYDGMVDYIKRHEEDISYLSLVRAVGGRQALSAAGAPEDEPGKGGYKFKDDWSASYHKSVYPDGTPVVYFRFSGIEHVFEPAGYRSPG